MNASASSAVAVRRASTTTSARDPRARVQAQRPSRRGWVTAGSARQATTSSARSRISPKVAVLDADRLVGGDRRAAARGIDHGPERLGERHRPALRLAARLAQAVDERRARLPQDRGRGVHGLVEAHRAAVDAGDRRPVAAALGEPRVAERARPRHRREPALRDGHLDVVAGAAAPRTRRVSHPPPPPRAQLRAQPRGLLLELPPARPRRRGGRHDGADRTARGDPLAGVRDVAHAALQPALAVADGHVLGGEEDRLAGCAASARPRCEAAHRRRRAGARRTRPRRTPPRSPPATRSDAG